MASMQGDDLQLQGDLACENAEVRTQLKVGGQIITGSGTSNGYEATTLVWNDDWLLSRQLAQGNGWDGIPVGAAPYSLTLSGLFTALTPVTGTQRIGVVTLDSGTTAAGYAALSTVATLSNIGDHYSLFVPSFEWVGGLPALSTVAEEFICEVGLVGNAPGYRVSFRYDRANFGNQWVAVTQEAGGPESITPLAIPIAPLVYPNTNIQRLQVVYNAKNLARWFFNGAEVLQSTAELPTHSLAGSFDILKTNGVTSRSIATDFTSLAVTFSPKRIP